LVLIIASGILSRALWSAGRSLPRWAGAWSIFHYLSGLTSRLLVFRSVRVNVFQSFVSWTTSCFLHRRTLRLLVSIFYSESILLLFCRLAKPVDDKNIRHSVSSSEFVTRRVGYSTVNLAISP
jgi:hypothetical protein